MTTEILFNYNPEQHKVTLRGIDHFPESILDLGDQVEILDMSTVRMKALPKEIARLTNLKILFWSHNPLLEEMPEILSSFKKLETIGMRGCSLRHIAEGSLPASLRALIVTDNKLTELPHSLGNLKHLQKLMATGNQLRALPKELARATNLEIIRLSVNQLEHEPEWLFDLPRLAWYADSSNPYSRQLDESHITHIDWHELTMGEEIGRSVNNTVHSGKLKDGREVAVKIYGGDMVTDGLAIDDMKACLQVGEHPNVIGGIGKVIGALDAQPRLAMPLVPVSYRTLGNSPSLSSVCRDTYPDDRLYSIDFVEQAAKSVANGMKHLHNRAVMHGDLYAHNIMSNAKGHSLVGDFGGASLYMPGATSGEKRQKIDARAFGILLEELITRCDNNSEVQARLEKLKNLQDSCMQEAAGKRPLFGEIVERLK